MSTDRLAVLLIVAASMGSGCGGDGSTTNIAYTSFEGPGGGVEIEAAGLVIKMDSSVRYESTSLSETGKPTVRKQTLNGMPFGLVSGGFTLGDQTYDGLEADDEVLITADGILVNGEQRWEFPGA